jgi:hypothetical protein
MHIQAFSYWLNRLRRPSVLHDWQAGGKSIWLHWCRGNIRSACWVIASCWLGSPWTRLNFWSGLWSARPRPLFCSCHVGSTILTWRRFIGFMVLLDCGARRGYYKHWYIIHLWPWPWSLCKDCSVSTRHHSFVGYWVSRGSGLFKEIGESELVYGHFY